MAGQAQTVAVTVRVGFLGAGFIATYHSKALRHSGEDVTWSGVYDLDQARAEAFGAITKARVCASEEELLDRCDAVFVCTWTAAHPESVAAAASRGLAVFCEKPLAVDLAGARQMGEAVERAGVVNQVGLVLRYSPAFCWMRHLISDPSSGRVMAVVFRDDQYIPIQGMYGSSWRSERAKAGSGTLLEHSIHDVDMIEFLCGPVGSVAINALRNSTSPSAVRRYFFTVSRATPLARAIARCDSPICQRRTTSTISMRLNSR